MKLILLCAGKSSRMGTPKGLLPIANQSWLEYQIKKFKRFAWTEIEVIVGGPYERQYRNLLLNTTLDVRVTSNTQADLGPFSSIQAGLSSLDQNVAIHPIDVPAPEENLLYLLSSALQMKTTHDRLPKVVFPIVQGKNAHPVFLSAEFCKHLKMLNPRILKNRLDWILNDLPASEKTAVATHDESLLKNLNTPADWENYLKTKADSTETSCSSH